MFSVTQHGTSGKLNKQWYYRDHSHTPHQAAIATPYGISSRFHCGWSWKIPRATRMESTLQDKRPVASSKRPTTPRCWIDFAMWSAASHINSLPNCFFFVSAIELLRFPFDCLAASLGLWYGNQFNSFPQLGPWLWPTAAGQKQSHRANLP